MDYRSVVYGKYASKIKKQPKVKEEETALQWVNNYRVYLKGWLPKNKESRILDIGCGSGRFLNFLKLSGYENIEGVDISQEQIELAKNITNKVYAEDCMEFLKSHENSYDLIVGIDIIEHFNKSEAVEILNLCYKSLKPDGGLIMQTPNAESPFGLAVRYGDITHEVIFTPESISGLLELFEYKDIQCRPAGPIVHGLVSLCRYIAFKFIWCLIALYNLIETGDLRSGIYSRVFFIYCKK